MALRISPDVKQMTAKVKRVRRAIPEMAKAAADAIRPVVEADVGSGRGANGESWPGATPERIAEIAASTKVSATASNRVYVRYRGTKGGTKRLHGLTPWAIVPGKDAPLPESYASAIDPVVQETFRKALS